MASHAGEIERLSIVLSQALETLLDGRNPRTLDIRLVSTSMPFIDYLKEIKPKKSRRIIESRLISVISSVNDTSIQTHFLRCGLGRTFSNSVFGYVCDLRTHQYDGLSLDCEKLLHDQLKDRMARTADFIYGIDRRLPIRPFMSKFHNIHR